MTTDVFRRMIDIIESVEDVQSERQKLLDEIKQLDDKLDDFGVEWADLIKQFSGTLQAFHFPTHSQKSLSETHEDKEKTTKQTRKSKQNKISKNGKARIGEKYIKSVLEYIKANGSARSEKMIKIVGGTSAQLRSATSKLIARDEIYKTGIARGTIYHAN